MFYCGFGQWLYNLVNIPNACGLVYLKQRVNHTSVGTIANHNNIALERITGEEIGYHNKTE